MRSLTSNATHTDIILHIYTAYHFIFYCCKSQASWDAEVALQTLHLRGVCFWHVLCQPRDAIRNTFLKLIKQQQQPVMLVLLQNVRHKDTKNDINMTISQNVWIGWIFFAYATTVKRFSKFIVVWSYQNMHKGQLKNCTSSIYRCKWGSDLVFQVDFIAFLCSCYFDILGYDLTVWQKILRIHFLLIARRSNMRCRHSKYHIDHC